MIYSAQKPTKPVYRARKIKVTTKTKQKKQRIFPSLLLVQRLLLHGHFSASHRAFSPSRSGAAPQRPSQFPRVGIDSSLSPEPVVNTAGSWLEAGRDLPSPSRLSTRKTSLLFGLPTYLLPCHLIRPLYVAARIPQLLID